MSFSLRSKKICLVIPSLRHGGAERVITILANEWAKNPFLNVTLLILTKQKKYYNLDERVNVLEPGKDYKRNIFSKFFYTIWVLRFIRENIKEINPDGVLSFCERYNNLVLLALKGTSINVFVSDRNNPNNNIGKIHEILRRRLYKSAAGIIAQTQVAKNILFSKTGNKNIVAIPNPLRDIVEYKDVNKENIILNVGRFEPQKNQIELVEMFSALRNINDWKLKILGIGTLRDEIELRIKDLNLEGKVELVDFQLDIDLYFQKAKVFAFTSIYEGFPNALAEAMANGLPVISYNCPTGPSELIFDGHNGDLIPLKNQDLYIERLQDLIDDENKRELYGAEAIQIRAKYSVSTISSQYLKFILNEAYN